MTSLRLSAAALLLTVSAPAAMLAQTSRPQAPARAAASGTDVDAALARAARAYRGVRSVRASFDQTLTNPLTGGTTVQRGTLYQQGKRWSARFTAPRDDRYVLTGRTLWVYTPSSAPRQALRLTLDPDAVASFDIVQQLAAEPRRRFNIAPAGSALVDGRAATALQLTPKTAGRLTKAAVWIDDRDGTVRQFELTESTGLVRRVQLRDQRFNVAIPAAEFSFTPPAGVRVVDQEAIAGGR